MFHGNLVHASPPNITPYPRKIVYLTFCAVSNHITKFTREEWIAHRDFSPILPVDDDALIDPCPRASRGGGVGRNVFPFATGDAAAKLSREHDSSLSLFCTAASSYLTP